MAESSKIEWTDSTFNPWVGCTKVSPACDHCYAEAWAKRSGSVQWGGERRRTSETNWRLPLKWNRWAQAKGRRIRVFCASLADVFDNEAPEHWRWDLFRLINATPDLDWLLLTKRIGNARNMLNEAAAAVDGDFVGAKAWDAMPWPNVWIGATVVNQAEADRDIPKLLATPARVRFLSVEPMLGPIDLSKQLWQCCEQREYCDYGCYGHRAECCGQPVAREVLDWVICGGESGPGARPMHPDWARSLRDQCAAAGVPFMFKQWGEHAPVEAAPADGKAYEGTWIRTDGTEPELAELGAEPESTECMFRFGKKAAGRLLDGRLHDGFPEVIHA